MSTITETNILSARLTSDYTRIILLQVAIQTNLVNMNNAIRKLYQVNQNYTLVNSDCYARIPVLFANKKEIGGFRWVFRTFVVLNTIPNLKYQMPIMTNIVGG